MAIATTLAKLLIFFNVNISLATVTDSPSLSAMISVAGECPAREFCANLVK